MDLLAAGQGPGCGEGTVSHCSSCKGCPGACACPPLPAVGTQILPKPGARHAGRLLVRAPHTVVATQDDRRDGEPDDHVIVCQLTALVRYAIDHGEPVDTDYGACLGLDDIEIQDHLPRITFTTKETA
ncbi:hypothetical protein BBK82_03640 [Lentzea guizhouensis]|uniref:Uncharacterized protein n=2 Tax=Lentzea guizhouensis TaxID=1586287 RepID=A0A1B2HC79_9PSEU|nr:hypothetical protein BBK82_03640 [Lentzea guizhouensis]